TSVIVVILLLMGLSVAYAQTTAAPPAGFENVRVSRQQQELEIQIKAMIPDLSAFQLKTDTYGKPGKYNFTINLGVIHDESNRLLSNWQEEINKWLEESK
ncbi:MAG: hypothetical protein Q8J62_07495, partial [Candidatus Cloacimonadaceae bacterium]|nr:hypothetical protein [Candidatus Cloacimonadaceae bacterium]